MSEIDFESWVIGFAGVQTVIGKVIETTPGRVELAPVFTLQTRLGKMQSPIDPKKEMGIIERSCVPFLHYFAIDRLVIADVPLVRVKDLTARDQFELSEAIKVAELMVKDMRRHDSLHAVAG